MLPYIKFVQTLLHTNKKRIKGFVKLPYDMFLIGKGNQFHLRFHLTYIFLSCISWFKLSEWIIKKFGHSRIPCKALPQQGQTTGAKCHVIGYNDCCVIAVLDSFSVQLCVRRNLGTNIYSFHVKIQTIGRIFKFLKILILSWIWRRLNG